MKSERPLSIFLMIFFLLGLMIQPFATAFKGWISWVIIFIGLGLYLLFYYWFMIEYAKEIKK